MLNIGDETEGYCPRCRLNTYQIVAATDGRSVQSVTCRTCRNSFPWRREVTPEELRERQLDKLRRLTRAKGIGPEVQSRTRRKVGDLDMLRQAAAALGREVPDLPADTPPPAPASAPVATSGGDSTDRWRVQTAKLGWRDGKPYQPTRTYKAGDVMLHKAHGLGVVQQVVHDGACVVLFRDQETVIEMGQAPQ
jgi:hypothetical protein